MIWKKNKKLRKRSWIARYLAVFVWRCFKKGQVREKISTANSWANANRKMTAGITIGLLSLSLVVGVLSSLVTIQRNDPKGNPLNEVADVQQMFQAMNQIGNMKSVHMEHIGNLVTTGERLQHELDSLMALNNKTHEDSLRIIATYKQLEIFARNLKNK